jgi:hypothetical protein
MPDLDHLTIEDAADLLYAAAVKLSETAAGDGIRDLEPQHALLVLDRLRAAVWHARTVDDALVAHCYQHGPRGDSLVDGIGAVFIGRTAARPRWDERATLQHVLDAKVDDYCREHQGEFPTPETVLAWFLEVASISYFRKTALRELGVPIDEVYSSEPGRPKVQLPGGRYDRATD